MKKLIVSLMLLCCTMVVCFSQTSVDGFLDSYDLKLITVPFEKYSLRMLSTELTQKLYKDIVGANQSSFKGDKRPVDSVSWYDAIYFCNLLSERLGLEPVYLVDGKTNVTEWKYKPHSGRKITKTITQSPTANGFCLPMLNEWMTAAFAGEDTEYSGSDNIDEVAWHGYNSDFKSHEVAQKKPNAWGFYDMTGNIIEWVWEDTGNNDGNRLVCGGCWGMYAASCKTTKIYRYPANSRENLIGFRIACRAFETNDSTD